MACSCRETVALSSAISRRELFSRVSTGFGDHHPYGFSVWLAGGGIRGGTCYGETDPFGHHAVENRVSMADLHGTILHLLGLDHSRLTFRHNSRDDRLTDVHEAKVLRELLA